MNGVLHFYATLRFRRDGVRLACRHGDLGLEKGNDNLESQFSFFTTILF